MNADGGRDFRIGEGRAKLEPADCPKSKKSIFLADFGGPIEHADTIRLHPNAKHEREPLRTALRRHGTAIGYNTTALVTAGLEGLEIVCKSSQSIMSQGNWLEILPYADWHFSEISSGEAIEYLWRSI